MTERQPVRDSKSELTFHSGDNRGEDRDRSAIPSPIRQQEMQLISPDLQPD